MKKKFLALLLCASLATAAFAKTWTLQENSAFSLDIDDTISQMLEDLGITVEVINEQLEEAGITLSEYEDEWSQISAKVQAALDEYSAELKESGALQEAAAIIPTVKAGFYDFSDALVDAIKDASSLQNTESAAWIGYFFFPGFHFRAGVDASVATFDINPLLRMTEALGYDLDLSNMTDKVKNIPVFGNYDHHLVFPTVALNARVGGLQLPFFKLPFDAGLSIMSIDTRGNLESVWPDDAKVNIEYLTFGMDFRYKLFKFGPGLMNVQISGMTGLYYTKGSVEAEVDQGSADFDFNQLSGMLGAQVTGHLVFVDAFFGAKLLTNLSSKVSVKATPNWDNILEIENGIAKQIAVALMPKEVCFERNGGWAEDFALNPVFYGGIGLSAKIVRLGVAASYNATTENLGATVNVRFSW